MTYPIPWCGITPEISGLSDTVDEKRKKAAFAANILVVDDEPRALDSLVEMLKLSGYNAFAACGGKEAVKQLQARKYDLMLLDLNMPDIDGQKVMEHVNSNHQGVDVIIVSGEATFDHATQALRRGAQDFLRKPFAPDELLRSVSNVIEHRRLREENKAFQRRLKESEILHKFIVNNSPDMIYLLDHEGKFAYINERVGTLLGYKQNEIIGEHFSKIIFHEDLERANYIFNERRAGNRATKSVELRLCSKDCHEPLYFDTRSVPVELNSIGIYVVNSGQEKEFIGTYGVARDITERKQAEELIRYQVYHDLLTNLPNRALFRDRLSMAIAHSRRSGKGLAIMYLDMDRFKIINDSLGHVVGDELLQQVAHRFRGGLREADTLARVGGDEFNLLIPEINSPNDASFLAQKILSLFTEPFTIGEEEIFVSFSIGISLFPGDGDSLDALIKHADIAMYHVKYSGKNGYAIYEESMKNHYYNTLDIENGLRRAIEKSELCLHYQPQIDFRTNRIFGVEALVRWNHPQRGLLTPIEFISIAEDTGLILQLGEWVLTRACEDAGHWRDHYKLQFNLSVNISVQQLESKDFVEMVLKTIEKNNMSPQMLELEITENEIMQDVNHVIETLTMLSKKGFRIAVDDFGTGYSSLRYLQTLPINTLKMDRSFVSSIKSSGDNSIIDAIIAMAKGLNLDLIAEGIENPSQLEYLKESGCAMGQGYFFSNPLPMNEFLAYVG